MTKPTPRLEIVSQRAMTPQLQRALRLLQLPEPRLQAEIQQALESNAMLEADEHFDTTWALPPDWDSAASQPHAEGEIARADDACTTLHDHLAWQLALAAVPNGPRAILRALIEAIDDNGYLTRTPQEIATAVATDVRADAGVVESVLTILQEFDPIGVGARSVSECIGLQLAQLEPGTRGLEAAQLIARDHLELADSQQFKELQQRTGFSDAEVETALALIRFCQRRPGSAFQPQHAEYTLPDVVVRRTPEGWTVELNPAATPRLRLNERSAGRITSSPDQAELRIQLQVARWLVGSLDFRNEMLLRIARTLVYRQLGFLERSEDAVQPLTLGEAAEAVEMHESVISRVTAGKYLHTPRGVFEFRFFISGQDYRRMAPAA